MIILGIDPGITGGLAIWNGDLKRLDVIDIPTVGEKAKRRVNVQELWAWLDRPEGIDHCFVERAQAMPKQGSSSGFLYGRAVGALEAVVGCLNIPMTIIESIEWKRFHNLKKSDKEASRQRAIQLLPAFSLLMARKMDHGRAESALIAIYGHALLVHHR